MRWRWKKLRRMSSCFAILRHIPNDETNLVVKAARFLQNRFPGKCGGVKIKLKKNIPSGAGLGGGSGNAAGSFAGPQSVVEFKNTA